MTPRRWLPDAVLLGFLLPSGPAAQTIDGEDTSWCSPGTPMECAVETYGPTANILSRRDAVQTMIDNSAITSGGTCDAIVGAAFADLMIEGEPLEQTRAGTPIPDHVGAHFSDTLGRRDLLFGPDEATIREETPPCPTEKRGRPAMKTRTLTLAAAALAATLAAGCTGDGRPDIAAVPDAEPGDPAAYAPDGWPLQIGDKISSRRRRELSATAPGLGGVEGINVVDGRTYGARFGYGVGFLPDEDFSNATVAWELQHSLPGRHYIYEGHFPEKVADTHWQHEHRLPEDLHGRIEYYEDIKSYERPDHQQGWEEQRARMRADGLLPTPDQMSPERRR